MNCLTIIGNLVRDPVMRTTNTGVPVCSFQVAVNRRRAEGVDYFNISAWRKLGEICAKSLSKGKKVMVSGPVSCSTYQNRDAQIRAAMDVTADEVEFLSPKDKQENNGDTVVTGYQEVSTEDIPWG